MSNQGFSELALQPLAPSDYSMVMAKSRENRLTFATWLMFFRDHGRFPTLLVYRRSCTRT